MGGHLVKCFISLHSDGCDGSVLLDSTSSISGEKGAGGNFNSLRGFDVVDRIKSAVDKVCGPQVVSCADILAVAARDSVVQLGGRSWNVELGRRDGTTASQTAANNALPGPGLSLQALKANFRNVGLNEQDLVVLSGGHSIGVSKCSNFKTRIYSETNIDPNFARNLRSTCPRTGGDNRLGPLDTSSTRFDSEYFKDLVNRRGLLHSDQVLFNGGSTDALVRRYSTNSAAFAADFGKSMIKMGKIRVLEGRSGQIRKNCRRTN